MRRASRWAVLLLAGEALRCQPPDTFDLWLQDRIDAAVDKARIGINGKSLTRQIGSPSASGTSASLVDHSSASDFVSTALNLAPIHNTGASPGGSSEGAGTLTTTLYSVLAGLNHTSLTDPKFYGAHTAARQLSFTVGTAQSDPGRDNSSGLAKVAGIKVTPFNQRDLYSKTGKDAVAQVQKALTQAARAYAPLTTKVRNLIFYACQPDGMCRPGKIDNLDTPSDAATVQAFAAFWGKYQTNMRGLRFTQDNLDQIDQLILSAVSAFAEFQEVVRKSYQRIHQGAQLALSYTTTVRGGVGYTLHRAELIYDYGLSDRITWTFNVTGDFIDRKRLAMLRGGTVSTEFLGRLLRESADPRGRRAMTVSFSGQSKWLTQVRPQYTVQSTLTIPLAPGIEVPVAFRWANRALIVDQSSTQLKVALNVDVGRIAAAFQ